jgi:tRNA (cytidine/uridine-2'-O-)-methyltransferase
VVEVVLWQPEIPPNTGNIIRLCANTGALLHLVRPLGFDMDDRELRRAGLDYHEYAQVQIHDDMSSLLRARPTARLLAFTTKGEYRHDQIHYRDGDLLLFGPESRGLPPDLLACAAQRVRIPMRPAVRSLNLSNAVAVAVYEVWRQSGYAGGAMPAAASAAR